MFFPDGCVMLLDFTKIQRFINWPLRVNDVSMCFLFPGLGYHQAALNTGRTVQAIPGKAHENPGAVPAILHPLHQAK